MSQLLYKKPAGIWEEAIPIGNGRLGAMIHGMTEREYLQVNEETMWYGGPVDRHNPDAYENLSKVRSLITEGKMGEAQRLMGMAFTGCPNSAHPYQTLGDVFFYMDGQKDAAEYERGLCLNTAVSYVSYRVEDTLYKREYFASFPDDCIAMRFTAEGQKKLSFSVQLGRDKYFDGLCRLGETGIGLYGNLGEGGSRFAMGIMAGECDGDVRCLGEYLTVSGASTVTLIFGAKTSFREKNASVTELCEELETRLKEKLLKGYEALLASHEKDYTGLYGRVELSLEGEEEKELLPTDERLTGMSEGKEDNGLCKLLFDYGRYLLISSSRPGNLPSNLQGIWNKDFMPPWDSKYTININAQMNYWPAEYCNLSECHEPLFDLLERLRINGQKTARKMYHCRGSLAHHNTDIHADSAPQDLWYPATFWTQGEAWLATHIWTHYSYTQDLDFLEKAFPVLVDCSLFYVDFLTEYKGYMVTNPSVSPENTYILPSGEKGCCCAGPTMDNQIIRDLFTMTLDSFAILNAKGRVNYTPNGVWDICELIADIRRLSSRLAPTRIGSDGRIMEWLEEYEEEEPGHRHISHLYGLYPSNQISVNKTPELAQAARKTLEHRLSFGGGHTGWSRAWIMNHYAKLWDGDKAYENICAMLIQSTYPNLFDKHPPFQIDGNFGACAAIAQMLVQSEPDALYVLPALPTAWKSGSIRGLKIVGGSTVDIRWEKHVVTELSLHCAESKEIAVTVNGTQKIVCMEKGQTLTL